MVADYLSWLILLFIISLILFNPKKGFEKSFLVLIFFLPIFASSKTTEYFLRGTVIRALIIIIFICFLFKYKKLKIPKIGPFKYYLLFIFISIISALLSNYPGESLLRALTLFQSFILFLLSLVISYNYQHGFQKINKYLYLGFVVTLLIGLGELITQNKFLFELGFVPEYSVNYLNEIRTFSGRISSFIGQPVYASFYFMICLIFPFYLLLTNKNTKNKIIQIIIISVALLCIYTTGTRASYPVVIFILIMLMLKFSKKNKTILIFSLILFISLFYIFSNILVKDREFLRNSFDLKYDTEANINLRSRIELSSRLFEISKSNFLLGYGPGNVQKAAFGERLPYDSNFEGLAGLENHYLTILADTGFLGFFIYLLFILFLTIQLYLIKKEEEFYLSMYKYLLFIMLISLMIVSFTALNLVSLPMSILSILIGNYFGKFKRQAILLRK